MKLELFLDRTRSSLGMWRVVVGLLPQKNRRIGGCGGSMGSGPPLPAMFIPKKYKQKLVTHKSIAITGARSISCPD